MTLSASEKIAELVVRYSRNEEELVQIGKSLRAHGQDLMYLGGHLRATPNVGPVHVRVTEAGLRTSAFGPNPAAEESFSIPQDTLTVIIDALRNRERCLKAKKTLEAEMTQAGLANLVRSDD